MADTDIALKIAIDASESADSVKELRKSLKELIDLQSKVGPGAAGFDKLSNAINETEGKIGDLNDSFQTLRGSGVERLDNSFGLLREGFTKFDAGKIKAGFQGIGAAMSAIPIFLIAEGFKLLMEHLDEIIDFFKELVGTTNQFTKELEELKKTNESLTKSIDNQIAALSGLKANEKEIIELTRQKIQLKIQEAKVGLEAAILNQKNAEVELSTAEKVFGALSGNLSTMQIKRKAEIAIAQADTKKLTQELEAQLAALQGFDNVATQKVIDNNKKIADEKKKSAEEQRAATLKLFEENNEAEDVAFEDKTAKISERYVTENDLLAANLKIQSELQQKQWKEDAALQLQIETETRKGNFAITQASLESTKQLTDLYFMIQLNRSKGLESEDLKIKKRMFVVNKAYALSQNIISTIMGITNALTASSVIPEPYATILKVANAVAVGIAGTVNTAKIAAQQFNSGGSGGAGVGTISLGGGGISAPPVVQSPQNSQTNVNPDGSIGKQNQIVIKNEIVETQITEKQNKVATIKETATFG